MAQFLSEVPARYVVRANLTKGWDVIDTETNLPAASDGMDIVALERVDAEDIANDLNRCERDGVDSPLV